MELGIWILRLPPSGDGASTSFGSTVFYGQPWHLGCPHPPPHTGEGLRCRNTLYLQGLYDVLSLFVHPRIRSVLWLARLLSCERKPCSPKTSLVAHATNEFPPRTGLEGLKDTPVLYDSGRVKERVRPPQTCELFRLSVLLLRHPLSPGLEGHLGLKTSQDCGGLEIRPNGHCRQVWTAFTIRAQTGLRGMARNRAMMGSAKWPETRVKRIAVAFCLSA